MLEIKIKGLDALLKDLEHLKKETPRAVAKALTKTGMRIREEVRNEMRKVFDKPTPYTLGSLYLKGATDTRWETVVWFKDFAGKGTPATKYLWPEVHGGERPLKRFEAVLSRKGFLPPGWYAVPGSGAKLNAYGNISPGQIVQILTALDSLPGRPTIRGIEVPIKKKNKNVKAYFAIRPHSSSHLAPGVYQRVGLSVKPILIFTNDKPTYSKRLPFYEIGQRVYEETFINEFDKAMSGLLSR